MEISKREFLKRLGLGSVGLAAGAAMGDEYVATKDKLPPGSIGNPYDTWYGRHIFPLEHDPVDVASATLVDGEVVQPARKLPVFHTTDVVVVGGGPAGFAAAIAAARTGAKVALVERYGSLGGLFANGLVLAVYATSDCGDGNWKLVTRGILEEFMTRAEKMCDLASTPKPAPDFKWGWCPTVNPEAAKVLMEQMVEDEKIDLFLHAWGVDVVQVGNEVKGIVFESKEGRQAILAKEVVDATGDGDVFFQAGEDYRQITHAPGMIARFCGFDKLPKGVRAPKGLDTYWWRSRGNEALGKTSWETFSLEKANMLKVRELTRADVTQRRKFWQHQLNARKTEEWKELFLMQTASQVGVRGTRLLDAVHVVTRAEARDPKTHYADCIGWCGKDGVQPCFPVPYGQLVPKKTDHLLVAGRCVGNGDTIDTFRLIAPCFVTGEAAGTAAALAVKTGRKPRDLDTNLLQKTLRAHGAYLG